MIIKIYPGFKSKKNVPFRLIAKLKSLFVKPYTHWQNVPVIINNFNRLDYLLQQLKWLEKAGMRNIYIIDNASTYPPLLDFYNKCHFTVFRLTQNVGHTALWDTHIQLWFKNQYYILTDPDIIPIEECPLDSVSYFWSLLQKYPQISKVGFGLKIDDLPDHYNRKHEVIKWESSFWNNEIEPNVYKAKIDTTFALYKPNTTHQQWDSTLRTGGKYIARHLPWYENSSTPSQEELFFKEVTTNISSWYKQEEYNG
jgi:hypothetical protein